MLETWYRDAIASIEGKKAQLNTSLECPLSDPASLADSIAAVNAILSRHNDYGQTQSESVSSARDKLAKNALAVSLSEYQRLSNAVTAEQKRRDDARAEHTRLSDRIRSLEAEIIGHQRPAEELNSALRRYLGHGELTLESTDTGYRIARNGEPANSLSEGEKTALALLYFLRSLKANDFNLGDGIVILDDPISSLDQSAMFAAFGAIREVVKPAKQIVVLTHNYTFFRLVRRWFKREVRQKKKERVCRLMMLRCETTELGRCSRIDNLDPLLENYESEYHYLFAKVLSVATGPAISNLEEFYPLPNMARRLLEMFMAFSVPDISNLWKQMLEANRVSVEPMPEASLSKIFRYTNMYSHGDSVGDDDDMAILAESRSVMNDLITFVRTVNSDHCSRMTRQCIGEDVEL